jgi:archaellin
VNIITQPTGSGVNLSHFVKQELLTALEGRATADVTIINANTFYSPTGASVTLTQGTWLLFADIIAGRTTTTATTYTGRIRDTSGSITLSEGTMYMASVANHYFTMTLHGLKVVPSGTVTVQVEMTANQGTSCVIKASIPTNGTGSNVATKIYALKIA